MSRFDHLAGLQEDGHLQETHTKGDVAPIEKAVQRAYLTLDAVKPKSSQVSKAQGFLLQAKKGLYKLGKTAESDSSFDRLAGLAEAGSENDDDENDDEAATTEGGETEAEGDGTGDEAPDDEAQESDGASDDKSPLLAELESVLEGIK